INGTPQAPASGNPSVTVNIPAGTPGVYNIVLTGGEDDDGTPLTPQGTTTAQITVHANPTRPTMTLSNGTLPLCYAPYAQSVTLSVPNVGGLDYQWYYTTIPPGDIGNPIGSNSNTHTTTSGGYYTVVITNGNGCSASSST